MRSLRQTTMFVFCLLALVGGLWAQGERGAITGVVRDASGAVVPGATVTVTNLDTNVTWTSITTDAGVYRVPYLPPGNYKVTVAVSGFKTAAAENVIVRVAQTITVDFALEVGEVVGTVNVTAAPSLLETATSEVGRSVSLQEFHTWPVLASDGLRQLQSFIFRSLPGTVGGDWAGSLNGGQYFAHDILIDGISVGRYDLTGGSLIEVSPSVDATSEFRLQTGTLSAQYGSTQTGVANFTMRSGTNEYHGTAYDYIQNEALNAKGFSDNALGRPKSPFKLNSFGATLGGPVRFPGLYNGKNRTFFFATYEGTRTRNFRIGGLGTMPTPAMKRGDFSALLDPAFTGDRRSGTQVGTDALGRPVLFGQIYDPSTTRLVGNTVVRDPFPGNIIPPARFSAIARNILQLAPIPDPIINSFLRNYPQIGTCCPVLNMNDFSIKVDHVINERHKLSSFFNWNERPRNNSLVGRFPPVPGNATSVWQWQAVTGRLFRLSEDWAISNNMLNHFAFGFNRFINPNNSVFVNQNWPEKIGLKGVDPKTHFPQLHFDGPALLGGGIGANGALGRNLASFSANGSYIFADDFSYIRGKHNFKLGTEVRRYYYNIRTRGNTSGTFRFHAIQTELPGFSNQTGFAFASFLLGAVRSTSRNVILTQPGYRVLYPAFYFQDDWKATPKFTLNYGLRWEIPGAQKEAHRRMSNLDLKAPNPAADNFPGALVFLEDSGRGSFMHTNYRQLGPRFGFAYNLASKLVLRGGYGITYTAPIKNGFGSVNLFGFNGVVNLPAGSARPFSQDPVLYWDNTFPQFQGALPNKNPSIANGSSIDFTPRDATKEPYVQNWNFEIQYELPWRTVLEVSYVGNKGSRLLNYWHQNLNQLDPRFLSLGDILLDGIDAHPEIPKPYPSFRGTVARALRPFPQYEGVSINFPTSGSSSYNSLQVMVTRRMSKGVSFLAAYTFSKTLTDADSAIDAEGGPGQTYYNRRADKSVASFHYPQTFKVTWIYDLPFGQGQRFLNRGGIADKILGGWAVTAIQQYRSGNPLSITTSIDTSSVLFNPAVRADVVPGMPQVVDQGGLDFRNGTRYLNPQAFSKPPTTSGGVPLRLGTAPRELPNVRGPAWGTEDFGVRKQTKVTESVNVEFRADFFNVFGRAGRGDPVTNLDSPLFGLIFNPALGPRTVQLMLRINY